MNKLRPATHEVVVDRDVEATMRDGTILRSLVYRPKAAGAFPVLLTRTPYGSDDDVSDERAMEFAERGYVAIRQDIRGRYTSDGQFTNGLIGMKHTDVEDGYDSVQWAAALPFANGKVGSWGISYDGWTSWPMAASQPPALVAITTAGIVIDSRDRDLSGIWRIVTQLNGQAGIAAQIRKDVGDHDGPVGVAELDKYQNELFHNYLWYLPLTELPKWLHGRQTPHMRAYLRNIAGKNHYDRSFHEDVAVPCLHMSGWYDIHLMCYKRFIDMKKVAATKHARENQKLILGPWRHNTMIMDRVEGDLDFGPQADGSYTEILCRWYDHWIKGIDNGIMQEAPVKLFLMGANTWLDAQDFPVPGTTNAAYYLHGAGAAHTPKGDGTLDRTPPGEEPSDSYDYDPRNPVPSLLNAIKQPTPRDQGLLDHRRDILVYLSKPLEHDLDVVGIPRAVLHVASSAPDTDFFVKLIDVYPDGRAINVSMGVVRARHRHGLENPKLLTPGAPVEIDIEMLPTANRFFAGHRIRVAVTSSDFPDFDRNHNTGGSDYEEAVLDTARNTLFHDAERPSRIELPVL